MYTCTCVHEYIGMIQIYWYIFVYIFGLQPEWQKVKNML